LRFVFNPVYQLKETDTEFIFYNEINILAIEKTLSSAKIVSLLNDGADLTQLKQEKHFRIFFENDLIQVENKNEIIPDFYKKNLGIFYIKESFSSRSVFSSHLQTGNICACILGIGGIGSVIFENLVRSGINKILLIDFDLVNEVDLNRQIIYSNKDFNVKKIVAAERYGSTINKNIVIQSFDLKINHIDDLDVLKTHAIDIFIQAADSELSKLNDIVNLYCFQNKISFFTVSSGLTKGYWGPLLNYNERETLISINRDVELLDTENLEYFDQIKNTVSYFSFGPSNMIIAAQASYDIISFLWKMSNVRSLNKRLFYDIDNLNHFSINYHE